MEHEMSSTIATESLSPRAARAYKTVVEEEPDNETVPVEVCYDDSVEDRSRSTFSFRRLMLFAGPGLLMSIAYVDPGNLESDLQTGAMAGYTLGWLIMWSTGLGFIVQLLAVRLGVVTGKDLAQTCRVVYPFAPRILLWIMAEIAIIGSDIQEVIGSAIAIQLLSQGAIPLWAGVLITGLDTFFLLYLERFGVRKLEGFFGVLIGIMTISFGVMYFKADVPGTEVVVGVALPRLKWSQLSIATGIVGSLVMPHNIFLHSSLVQSRKIDTSHTGAKEEALLYNAIESGFSLSITVFINICVMAVFARGFHDLPEADRLNVGLSTAGKYLGAHFGDAMMYIWALGLLAAGQSSTMTGTYTGQFVMGGFLDMKVSAWMRAAVTRSVALVPTLIVAFAYAGTNQMDRLNQDLNVLQSLQLPFALIPVLYITSREDIMGSKFVVKSMFRAIVYAICGVLLLINLSVVVSTILGYLDTGLLAAMGSIAFAIAYALFVGYLLIGPRRAYMGLVKVPGMKWLANAVGDGSAVSYAVMAEDALVTQSDELPLFRGRDSACLPES